ncbi:MAG TPA: hypothetical protein PLP69_01870 [Bacteroidales bacterium]|nr:hypothetical protein [Bacteroidales bacterium]
MKKALLAVFFIAIVVSCNKSDSPADIVEEPGVSTYSLSDLIGVWDCETADLNGCVEYLNISNTEVYSLLSCVRSWGKLTDPNFKFEGNKLVLSSWYDRRTYIIKELTSTSLSVTVYSHLHNTTENKIFKKIS